MMPKFDNAEGSMGEDGLSERGLEYSSEIERISSRRRGGDGVRTLELMDILGVDEAWGLKKEAELF